MPVPNIFTIAPGFVLCVYCGKLYVDTLANTHNILVEKDGERRIFTACVHCITKAKESPAYDDYMTNKTFDEKLGRRLKK